MILSFLTIPPELLDDPFLVSAGHHDACTPFGDDLNGNRPLEVGA